MLQVYKLKKKSFSKKLIHNFNLHMEKAVESFQSASQNIQKKSMFVIIKKKKKEKKNLLKFQQNLSF